MSYSTSIIIPNKTEKAEAWSDVPAIAQRALQFGYTMVIEAAKEIYNNFAYYKEKYLDPMAWSIVNVVLEKMSQDIIKWINSGFEGKPAFVQNPETYFIDIADKVVGDAIWGTDFKFLCSPFALDIKIALELQYVNGRGPDYQYTSQCTLSGVIDNVDNFFAGDFLSSGWKGWMEVTTKPQNNPIGAMAMGSMHLSAKLDSKIKAKSDALSWGRGMMSTEICTDHVVEDGDGTYQVCKTVTPGAAIQDQLSKTLGIPADRLTVADEFNEMINALFNQLVLTAFNKATGGLLGLTERNVAGASGSGRYFSQLEESNIKASTGDDVAALQDAILLENRFLAQIIEALSKIEAVSSYKENTYGDRQCHTGELNETLRLNKSKLEVLRTQIQTTVTRLRSMIDEYVALSTNTTLTAQQRLFAQQEINQEYLRMIADGDIHRETHIATFNVQDVPKIDEAITAFKQEVDAACIFIDTGGGGGGDAF